MIVIKLGGGADIDPQPLLEDLAALEEPWILVHGGNEELTALSQRLGHPARFVTSPSGHVSRFTDEETLRHIQMAYRGRINNDLVRRLNNLGCSAIGLSGVDGGLLRARRKPAIRVVENGTKMLLRGDHTGTITEVRAELLGLLLEAGHRPVVTLPALGEDGSAVNVDGDRAAASIAAAVGATRLIILSNVPGLLRDVDDPDSLIPHIPRAALSEAEGFAQGRFKKKMMAVDEALQAGVENVTLGTAHGPHPLQAALGGLGTVIA